MDNEKDGVFVQPNALFVRVGDSLIVEDVKWQDAGLHDFNTISGVRFPYRNILNETIRNTFFHVALWFAMFVLLVVGLYHAVQYLRTGIYDHDIQSSSFNRIAIMFGVLGLITGSIWAKFTWNTFWTTDVKLNMTAVAMLIYLAYLVLRGSSSDHDKRARISAAYSIFAFLALIPLVFVIPRLTDSLHPGNGGNPALGGEDLDYTLRLFFYPSIIALILLGTWMAALLTRYERIKEKILQKE
jgi:heme exporter protein C